MVSNLCVSFQKLDYITYLASFDQLFDISKDRKNAEYKKYVRLVCPITSDKAKFHISTLNNVGVLKVPGDAAGVPAGLH